MIGDPEDDVDTIELIARWLEACAPGAPWELRRLARSLRSGQWLDDKPRRSDVDVLLARVDDHLSRGGALSSLPGPELAAAMLREQRRDRRAQQVERREQRLGDEVEAFLQSRPEGTTE